MITVTGATVRFGATTALNGVDAHIPEGRVVGVVGPNGSGKTTLLRVMAGLVQMEPPGTLQVGDRTWTVGSKSSRPVAGLEGQIALVAQSPESPGQLRVVESVMLGRAGKRKTWSRHTDEDWDIAAEALRQVGALHLLEREVATLSGGERQRVAVARALTQDAPHLLLDEPTNHLDVRYQHEILELACRVGTTCVVVLHDLNLASRYCHELIVLSRGSVVAAGDPSDVLDPDLISSIYGIEAVRHDWHRRAQLYFAPEHEQDSTRAPGTSESIPVA